MSDGDVHNARYLVWKYKNKKEKLWKSLEKKYGAPVLKEDEWPEEDENGDNNDEADHEDLDDQKDDEEQTNNDEGELWAYWNYHSENDINLPLINDHYKDTNTSMATIILGAILWL